VPQPDARLAKQLEADAVAYPGEREEILIEAADAWQRAGQPDRARAILDDLIRTGDEFRCDARVQLADLHLQAGEVELARAELDAAAKDPALSGGHCELAAELLAEYGDLDGAARWYDRAAARLTTDELDALRDADERVTFSTAAMLRGRRHVRRQLGLASDVLDTLVPDRDDLEGPVTPEHILDLIDAGTVPGRIRMLALRRDQRRLAQQRWPDVYDTTDDEYYTATEQRWREIKDSGVRTIVVVPADVGDLVAFADRHGGSATDGALRQRYCETVPDSATIPWPPERNAPCWCGTDRKYKKCCGRPGV
jgi:tetratricopeptide (TPR) repeat protein